MFFYGGKRLMNTVELVTNCGTLKGLDLEDHREFLGIKYANAGRWEYPEVVTSWDGILDLF
jgi:carboxylesterase type B